MSKLARFFESCMPAFFICRRVNLVISTLLAVCWTSKIFIAGEQRGTRRDARGAPEVKSTLREVTLTNMMTILISW
ncbi:hypothetical protein B0T16DRAFT_451246 [Cercophora newfieldiana]|uniref:Uncharacterized protein n=1 Tax=Cercophora newfieldiana TaxID=92897 RepID=A0AA40CXW5_9PEZI|nr:hypothetical protein B0T16DRAFT_451246 [Cercophora newfieldiana]